MYDFGTPRGGTPVWRTSPTTRDPPTEDVSNGREPRRARYGVQANRQHRSRPGYRRHDLSEMLRWHPKTPGSSRLRLGERGRVGFVQPLMLFYQFSMNLTTGFPWKRQQAAATKEFGPTRRTGCWLSASSLVAPEMILALQGFTGP